MSDEREDREPLSREEIEAPFKLNVNSIDKMLALVTGQYRAPSLPGEPDRITAPIPESGRRSSERTTQRAPLRTTASERSSHPEYEATTVSYSPAQTTRYAQVVKELDRFEFSEDEAKRNRQMETIIAAIRTSLQDLVIKEVANNTRKAFGEYVKDVFKVGGGIKINFDFNGTAISISARGAFTGDETVCVARQDDKLVASVLRIDENGKTDLTSNFGITLGE